MTRVTYLTIKPRFTPGFVYPCYTTVKDCYSADSHRGLGFRRFLVSGELHVVDNTDMLAFASHLQASLSSERRSIWPG